MFSATFGSHEPPLLGAGGLSGEHPDAQAAEAAEACRKRRRLISVGMESSWCNDCKARG